MGKRKNWLALLAAALVFIVAVVLLQPPPQIEVVAAARDLPPGHTLTEDDLTLVALPQAAVPPDAFADPSQVAGQTLAVARSAGDIIRPGHLGRPVRLAPDEREIGIRVVDASGLAGTLGLGDKVGVVAVLQDTAQQGAYAKAVIEGLRVTYIDPDFVAREPQESQPVPTDDAMAAMMATYRERAHEGTVNVAVPITLTTVVYQFTEPDVPPVAKRVNTLELLAALGATPNATLYLYRMGEDAEPFNSPGLWLPDLMIFPATPTPTPTPEGWTPPPATPTPASTLEGE